MKVITTFKMGNIYNSNQDLDYNVYQNSKHSMCEQIISWNSYYIPWSLNFIFTSILSLLIKYIFTQSLDLDHKTKSKEILIETLASYRAQK